MTCGRTRVRTRVNGQTPLPSRERDARCLPSPQKGGGGTIEGSRFMNAGTLFKSGKLQEAIAAQVQEVKSNPADQAKRLFLFEMLAFAGELDRAQRQIEALKFEEMEVETAALNYRKLLDAERARRRLFREGLQPQSLADFPEHVRLRLE